MSDTLPTPPRSASPLAAACAMLALLYFGRAVLEPVALAAILSLATAPAVNFLMRLGLRRLTALLVLLLLAGACVAGAGVMLVSQLAGMRDELPQYRTTLQHKAGQLRAMAERVQHQAGLAATPPDAVTAPDSATGALTPNAGYLARAALHAGQPLAEAGLVLLLLLFILQEHESLQDRLVRLAGHAGVSRTVLALGDAAQGVSRFFFCQAAINATFGALVGLGLWCLGLSHALLWGALSGLLRFIPYLGALGAGAMIAFYAAAAEPGWQAALTCVALYGALELLVAHFVEPKVYGHGAGLSPLAVMVSALFWGTLWGPVGLLISTPLTLCLVVAGRHVRAMQALPILLSPVADVTSAQRFFRRALSGETGAIVRDAGAFLQRASFARYCDQVLLPGLRLAATELQLGNIAPGQQDRLRRTVAELAESLTPTGARPVRRHVSLLNANVGAHLRGLREARLGRWQGPLDVPQRSIVLCAGLPTERDELASELLARALREAGIDARSVSLPLPHEEHAADSARLVATVLLPIPLPDTVAQWREAGAAVRGLLPQALMAAVELPGDDHAAPSAAVHTVVDMTLHTFEECLAFCSPRPRTGD